MTSVSPSISKESFEEEVLGEVLGHESISSNSGPGGDSLIVVDKKGETTEDKDKSESLVQDNLPRERQRILFYNKHEPYFEFTNFAYFPVTIDNVTYPTTEHYFQSQKLYGTPHCHEVAKLPSARQAFEYPRKPEVRKWMRKDWEQIKDDVMYKGLYYKFTQNDGLFKLLVSTGDAELVEDSPHDSYWGNGPDGNGKNKLGNLLMNLREHLKTNPELKPNFRIPQNPITPLEIESDNVINSRETDNEILSNGREDITSNRLLNEEETSFNDDGERNPIDHNAKELEPPSRNINKDNLSEVANPSLDTDNKEDNYPPNKDQEGHTIDQKEETVSCDETQTAILVELESIQKDISVNDKAITSNGTQNGRRSWRWCVLF